MIIHKKRKFFIIGTNKKRKKVFKFNNSKLWSDY